VSKDTLDKAADAIKKTTDDVKDTIHEGTHRTAADAERARREGLGDEMTGGEKARSVLNEAKHRTQAEIDAAKRNIRDHT
jgi:hypothetical protein